MFGASPFFRVIVHSDKNISLIANVSDHMNPLTNPPDFSRSRSSSTENDAKMNMARLSDLLYNLIRPTVNESDARNIVADFLKQEADIRRILPTGREHSDYSDGSFTCDSPSSQKTLGELQIKYNGIGINWFLFFQNVLDTTDVADIRFCKTSSY
ncbi:uncharacterized protein LOC131957136 [Physella acuta]|uniref:uncharacterized protein LOC131957136 n=1 Tax=Physella acuta TaxID=109671 RepID=UPI0027DB0A44|nr:uncharacterized protein LOC131957136 [Physella acuta]